MGDCVRKVAGSGEIVTLSCLPNLFQNLINAGLTFAGIAALFFVIIAGLKFLTSGGEVEKVASAKKTFNFAILGFVIVLLSFTLLRITAYVLNAPCLGQVGFSCEVKK